ncbi:MAG: hypothetical protein LBV27_03915 [Oscillospiraceae bacterium]|nr:hypothetical protein [Oscillospiraceae bacterium]
MNITSQSVPALSIKRANRARVGFARESDNRAAALESGSRPQNREKIIITVRALSNARGVAPDAKNPGQ